MAIDNKSIYSTIGGWEVATIANGAPLSGAINTGGMTPVRLQLPASLEGTALTFQVSIDGVTYTDFYDEFGVEVNYPCGSSRTVDLPTSTWKFVRLFKIRTQTGDTDTNQTGAASIVVQLEGL